MPSAPRAKHFAAPASAGPSASARGQLPSGHPGTVVMFAPVTSDYLLLIPLGWLLGVRAGLGLPGIYLARIGLGGRPIGPQHPEGQ